MAKVKIPRDDMREILWSDDVVRDRITSHGRWTVNHELIFRRDDKLWRAAYSKGATEYQDESPWEYEEVVTCEEVREVLAVDYEVVP
jgi:hypothetical protein